MITPANSTRKKLLVILGAGSSMACGLPGVNHIDQMMKEWSPEWKDEHVFPHGTGQGIFNDVWEILEEYYRGQPDERGFHVNFERVLGEMTALAGLVTPAPFGSPLRLAVKDGTLSERFTWPTGDDPYLHRQLILKQQAFLLKKLAGYMRERSSAIDHGSDSFRSYQELFTCLRSEFDLGVYNLNYDDLAVRAQPGAFTGFTDGWFDPAEVNGREAWDFVYHLHGSVHYSFTGWPASHEISWHDDLDGDFVDDHPVPRGAVLDFKPLSETTLIAGGFKLDQLLSDPFQSFQASLVRHVHEADACLIIGYGFGDHHVNRALLNGFDAARHYRCERPSVVVLDYRPEGWRLGVNEAHDYRARALARALDAGFFAAAESPPGSALVRRMRESGHFEIDLSEHVAAWCGGLLEARPHLAGIIAWLRQ